MVRAGLIIGGVMLVSALLVFGGGYLGLPLPPGICIPCLALFAGALAGYLAGQFDRPASTQDAARVGAGAGAIGGAGALLGHVTTGLATAVMVGPEGAADILRQFGIDIGPSGGPAAYYGGAVGGACCFGLFEVALMAALGALGGFLWYQMTGSKAAPPVAM
jgi:hypothetical protein